MGIGKYFGAESDMLSDIDPTRLCLGDDDDFVSGPFDHTYDAVDSRPVLHATREYLMRPGVREDVARLVGKVIGPPNS